MPPLKDWKKLYEPINDTMFLFDWNDGNTFSAKIKHGEGFSKYDTDLGVKPAGDAGFSSICKTKINIDVAAADKDFPLATEVKLDATKGTVDWVSESTIIQKLDDTFKDQKLLLRGSHGKKNKDGTAKEDPLELGHKIDGKELKMENYITL